jgi:hypothetical protein
MRNRHVGFRGAASKTSSSPTPWAILATLSAPQAKPLFTSHAQEDLTKDPGVTPFSSSINISGEKTVHPFSRSCMIVSSALRRVRPKLIVPKEANYDGADQP